MSLTQCPYCYTALSVHGVIPDAEYTCQTCGYSFYVDESILGQCYLCPGVGLQLGWTYDDKIIYFYLCDQHPNFTVTREELNLEQILHN